METFCPSLDDTLQREGSRSAALYAGVEDGTVGEEALIVAHDAVGSLWRLAVTLLEHHVLQTRSGGDDTWLLGILSEVFLALSLHYLALLGSSSTLFLLLFDEEVLYYLLCLSGLNLFCTSYAILDSLCEIVYVQTLGTHLSELCANAQSEGVT